MLWWWLVGESRDIRWMRNWSASIFVILVALSFFGAGVILTRAYEEARYRTLISEFTKLLEERMAANRAQDVRDALSHVNNVPDEWSSFSRDQVDRVREVNEAMKKTSAPAIAKKDSNNSSH